MTAGRRLDTPGLDIRVAKKFAAFFFFVLLVGSLPRSRPFSESDEEACAYLRNLFLDVLFELPNSIVAVLIISQLI